MELPQHDFSQLFAQLGLPDDPASIDGFIAAHAPLPGTLELADAPCWNESQAQFLRNAVDRDADWAEVVDSLDARLRHDPTH